MNPQPVQQLPSASASLKLEDCEMASISISSRIPEFWTDQPRVWFVRAESVINPQKLADEAKFNLIISKLGKEPIQQVTDILVNPPNSEKYNTLKQRLLDVYEESENRQIQKLIGEMELGDQKPSQLLRRMRDLARDKIPDGTLRILWQSHLPAAARAVLAVAESSNIENLAVIADKVVESTPVPHLSEITPQALQESPPRCADPILAEIAKLTARLDQMDRFRSHSRGRNYTHRSRSSSRKKINSPNWLCFYHYRYKERANKCIQPCAWKTSNKSEN